MSLHCVWVLPTAIGVRFWLTEISVRLPQSACSLRSACLSPTPTLYPRRSGLEGLGTKLLLLGASALGSRAIRRRTPTAFDTAWGMNVFVLLQGLRAPELNGALLNTCVGVF